MDYKLANDSIGGISKLKSDGLDGIEVVCSPGVFKCIQSDIEGFASALSDAGLLKKRKRDSETWSEPKLEFLRNIIEDMAPKLLDAVKPNSRNKIWGEVHKRFQDVGYEMSQKQVAAKCTSILREYEKVRRHNIETRENKECAFKAEMDWNSSQWSKGVSNEDDMEEEHAVGFFKSENLVNGVDDDDDKVEYCNWPEQKVKLLLSSVEEMLPKIGEAPDLPKKSRMWEQITQRFHEKGYQITIVQVQNKYTSLVRQYRRMKARCKDNGKPLSCPYKEDIERILKTPSPISQPCTFQMSYIDEMNSNAENLPDFMSADESKPFDTNIPSPLHNTDSTTSGVQTVGVVEEIRKIRQMKESYYREKKEYLNRKKLHLERKEEHMRRKEALLRAVLSKLEKQ